MRLSIDVTIEPREDEDSDFDYESRHLFSAVLPAEVNRAAEDITLEEMEFGMEHETDMEEEEEEDEDLPVGKGIVKISTEEECRELPELQTCLVFLKQIITLAEYTILSCKECCSLSEIHNNFIGSALYLKWEKMLKEDEQRTTYDGRRTNGDGRMNSPGHCAQYCTYTIMENSSKKILAIQTLDKRIVDRKSANMEKKGFQTSLDELHNRDITIKEVVTDAHMGIGALMSK